MDKTNTTSRYLLIPTAEATVAQMGNTRISPYSGAITVEIVNPDYVAPVDTSDFQGATVEW